MPLYVVVGIDDTPHSDLRRDRARAKHRAYVKARDQDIRLAAALHDARGSQCGSLYLVEADDTAEVRRWLGDEPFVTGGVYKELIVREISLAYQLLPTKNWGDIADSA